jgi:DNA polymerase elongation subunit (family B)
MATLVFDIETVGEDFDAMDETTQEILTWWLKKQSLADSEYEAQLAELKDGLGFSPLTGSIVAIGVLDLEKDKGCVYFQAPGETIADFEEEGIKYKALSEKEMLQAFWDGAKQYQTFVTFNGRAFDVPFLMVRSAVQGVKPSKDLMSNRYLSSQKYDAKHVDLFDQLSFYSAVRKPGNLHMWCRAFGIDSPKADGVSGDDVKMLFDEKRFTDIARYNVRDIRATGALYQKWREYFSFTPAQ